MEMNSESVGRCSLVDRKSRTGHGRQVVSGRSGKFLKVGEK